MLRNSGKEVTDDFLNGGGENIPKMTRNTTLEIGKMQ